MIANPDGFGNLLSMPITSVWATIWLTDGIGWLLASSHSDKSIRFIRVGLASSTAGTLWLAAACLYKYVHWTVSYTMLSIAGALIFASVLRYFVWSGNWQPIRYIISRIGEKNIRYDAPEVIFIAIIWLVSLGYYSKGVFIGSSLIFWNIAGSISCVRMFDRPAAVGIGTTPIARLIAVWLSRFAIVTAIIIRLVSTNQ